MKDLLSYFREPLAVLCHDWEFRNTILASKSMSLWKIKSLPPPLPMLLKYTPKMLCKRGQTICVKELLKLTGSPCWLERRHLLFKRTGVHAWVSFIQHTTHPSYIKSAKGWKVEELESICLVWGWPWGEPSSCSWLVLCSWGLSPSMLGILVFIMVNNYITFDLIVIKTKRNCILSASQSIHHKWRCSFLLLSLMKSLYQRPL